MKLLNTKPLPRRSQLGATLPEVVFAMLILSLAVLGCIGAVTFSRVTSAKARDQAVLLDFATHYLETLRGMPFADLRPGSPVNALYNGADGAPDLRVPASPSPIRLDTSDYSVFHPGLIQLASQQPEMVVQLTERAVGGVPHDKTATVEVRCQPPLGRGSVLSLTLTLYRVKDF